MIDYRVNIKTLKIKNFRRFKELNIYFDSPDIAIFAGRNGVGKTTILEAINIALSEKNSKFVEIKESDFYSEDSIVFEVTFDNAYFYQFDDPDNGYKGLVPCYGFKKEIKRRERKEPNKMFSSEYDVNIEPNIQTFEPTCAEFQKLKQAESFVEGKAYLVKSFIVLENEYQYTIASKPKDLRILYGYEIGLKYAPKVLFPDVFYFDNDRNRELLSQYNTAFSNIVTELNWRYKRELLKSANEDEKDELLNIFDEFHEKINKLDNHEKELVAPAIDMVRNDFGMDIDENLCMKSFNFYKPYENALFGNVTKKQQMISAMDYGSGVTMLLAVSLVISFAKYSKSPIIILIDEPELHLHADLQKNLFFFLKEIGTQVFLSTHSPLLMDKVNYDNNYILEDLDNEIVMKQATQLDLSDLQLRLLGNSLSDLYIPDNILIVEGKHDSDLIKKCLVLLGYSESVVQIIVAGGKDKIPNKPDEYEHVIEEILVSDKWYSSAIKDVLKIIIDGDVSVGKVASWQSKYEIDLDKQVKHLDPDNELCMEYYLPESLVVECVDKVKLNDNSKLRDKDFQEIIKIILEDDKIDAKKKEKDCQQGKNRVSKSRLNKYVVSSLTLDILNSEESKDLKEIVEWIVNYNTE